jgi:hypothetical protein
VLLCPLSHLSPLTPTLPARTTPFNPPSPARQPRAGSLLIFFSRTADGEIDPRSWHGGERLRPPPSLTSEAVLPVHASEATPNASAVTEIITEIITEKRILTLFKEVDYAHTLRWPAGCGSQTFENYLAPQIAEQRRHLQELADVYAGQKVPIAEQ